MKNTRLAEIIVDPASCSGDEAREIIILTDQFPYSAVLHILTAKIASEKKTPDKDRFLTRAAIISTDRSQLKQYITTRNIFAGYEMIREQGEKKISNVIPGKEQAIEITIIPGTVEKKSAEEIIQDEINSVPPKADRFEPSIKPSSDYKLVEELMENIAIYRDQRKKFDDILSGLNKAENKDSSLSSNSNEEKSDDITKTPRKRKSSGKLAKEEQDLLINKFIVAESEIKKSVKSADKEKKSKEDLSQISSEFSDETVTETLAGIMISQGKFEKAIDIYRKLIWKLPQKKAYFASQIELLKEKILKQ